MRETLTLLAVLLILVLATALAGPYFVDWTAQRPLIEARLASILGRPVQTRGSIDLKLLPSPSLGLQAIDLPEAPGLPGFSAQGLRLELSPMPLLRGEIHFVEADISQPKISAVIGRDGTLRLPFAANAVGGDTRFEQIRLHQATLQITDEVSGRLYELPPFDFEGEAASLAGPLKGVGQIFGKNSTAGFRLATSLAEDGKYRLRAGLDEAGAWPQSEADGVVSFSAGPDGVAQWQFDGTGSLTGHVPGEAGGPALPWRMAGAFQASRSKAEAALLEFRLGPEEGGLTASGSGAVVFGERPAASLSLAARQLDLDRPEGVGLLAALRQALADASLAAKIPLDLAVDASTPLLNLGGQILPDASARLKLAAGQPVALVLAMNAPGRSSLSLNGVVEPGAAAGFRGDIDMRTRDSRRLADWIEPLLPQAGQILRALPFRRIEMAGRAEVSAVNFTGRDLSLQMDRSSLRGALAFTRAVGNDPARIFADLTSPALDLDEAPDLSAALAAGQALDMSVSLDARAVKLARLGEGMVDAGRIRLKLNRRGRTLALENFTIENLGGANVLATAAWEDGKGRLELRLDAQRLTDLTDLLRRITPGPLADSLAGRAGALSPANMALVAEAVAGPDGQLVANSLSLNGTAGATKIAASLRNGSANSAVRVSEIRLEAPEASALLRQLGLEAVGPPGAGPGTLTASLSGSAGTPLDVKFDAVLAGTRFSGAGKAAPGQASLAGTFKAESPNISPLLRLFGVALPDGGTALPVAMAGDFDGGLRRLAMSRLSGSLNGAHLEGSALLERMAAAAPAREDNLTLGGALSLDRLRLSSLTALALGPPQPPAGAALWAETRLGAGVSAAPQTSLALSIGTLDMPGGFAGSDVHLQLELAPGVVALRDIAMKLNGGTAGGELVLRRDGPTAAISGALSAVALPLRQPSLEGLASFSLELTSTGASAAALAGGLAGTGKLQLAAGRVPGADKGTIAHVLAFADKGQLTFEAGELKRTLARELDRGSFDLGDQAFDLTIAAGTLRLAPASADGPMKLALDLRNFIIDQRLVLAETALPTEWAGVLPKIEVSFKGPANAPQRDVDAGNFINDVAAREIARDTAKIAALDADIRERAMFNRRAKAFRQMRQNEIDLSNFLAAEAKRIADEQKRLAEEEARRAAEEEKRRIAEAQRLERDRKAAEEAAKRTSPPTTVPQGEAVSPLNILPRAPDGTTTPPPLQLPGAL